VPFQVKDVSVDHAAANEMVRRTRQMGVPVIADDQEAIAGFDVPRLQRMASRHKRGPGLGMRVADATDGPGAYVGAVRPDTPAERAGVQAGDVVEELSGLPVRSATDLEKIARQRSGIFPTSIMVRRDGTRQTLILRG
jgi:S1-C subfamily serine protease